MRELGDTQLPATGPVLTDPRNPRNTGLFQGYGGKQNILEREGADPSDLQTAAGSREFIDQYVDIDTTFADIFELIDFLQGEIERTPGSRGTKPIQSALDRFEELVAAYESGDATLQDLKDFDPGMLGNMPQWVEFFNNFIVGEETGGIDNGDGTSRYGSYNLPDGYVFDEANNTVVNTETGEVYPIIPGMYDWYVNLPNVTPEDNDDDNDAGGGGGGGGEEGGEAGASDDGGEAGGSDDGGGDTGGGNTGDTGDSDSGGDDGSTDSGGGNLDQGDGEGQESTPQYYEVDENGNVFILDGDDEDGFWDENGFWNGAWKRIGNINDGTGAWWEDFELGGIYGEHGELIIRPESDPDPDSDDDDDDDDDTDDLTPDPDLFGGGVPTDPGPPVTGGPNPPSVNDGDGEGTLDTDPNTGEPQTGGPQPPGGGGDDGAGSTDDGTDTGGGGDDTGGGGGGSDGGGGGGDGGGDGTGGGDGSGGDGSGGEGDGGDGSGDGSGGDGSGDGLGGGDSAFDADKRFADLPFVVPDLYDVPQQRGMFLLQIGQPDSSLMLDDFFIRNFNRKNGMLV